MTIKAIETRYRGYRFRSRLEARWAVFFDALGIEWQYEPEGFELADGTRYLPDFWLPKQRTWVEIKGQKPTDDERMKCYLLADGAKCPVFLVSGNPSAELIQDCYWLPDYKVDAFYGWQSPSSDFDGFANYLFSRAFDIPEDVEEDGLVNFLRHVGYDCSHLDALTFEDRVAEIVRMDREYFFKKYGKEHPVWQFGVRTDGAFEWSGGVLRVRHRADSHPVAAYAAARGARFEHGESGAR